MTLYEKLFGEKNPRCIALVGAGGKTSCIKTLAAELAEQGKKAIITTTTKIRTPEDPAILGSTPAEVKAILTTAPIAWAGVYYNAFKIQGLDGGVAALCTLADCVLIEADGAKGYPLKMIDAAYEPQIPPEADAVVAVAGMDAIGQTVAEAVHRPALACAVLGVGEGHIVTPQDAARLLQHCYAPKIVLLNKADNDEKRAAAEAVSRFLPGVGCVITSLLSQ